MPRCNRCGASMKSTDAVCKTCGKAKKLTKNAAAAFPMKWYNFLVYFYLFLTMANDAYNGIKGIVGAISNSSALYKGYNITLGLRIVDIVYGVALLALAWFAFYVRGQLAAYKQKSTDRYLIFLAVSFAVSFIRSTVFAVALNSYLLYAIMIIISAIIFALEFVLSRIYFKKRARLFVN